MKTRRVMAMLIVALAMAMARVGVAQADKKSDALAKDYYIEGTKYYNLGEFPKAVDLYKKAYEAKPDPVFLYNIAQAYRLSNDFTQALFFYKTFLRNLPEAPNKAEVERRIKEMEEGLAKQKATANAPPNGPVAPGTDPPETDPANNPGTDPATDPSTDPSADPGTGIPDPGTAAAGSDAGQENSTAPSGPVDTGGGKKPIYKKWWFWAGVGAVAVGTIAIVAASSGGGGASGPPDSHFGSTDVF